VGSGPIRTNSKLHYNCFIYKVSTVKSVSMTTGNGQDHLCYAGICWGEVEATGRKRPYAGEHDSEMTAITRAIGSVT